MSKTKQKFLYRLGTTSYIYPAGIYYNVNRLKEVVDDIELLFYEFEESKIFLSDKNIKKLLKIKNNFNLTYTVHLPLDLTLAAAGSEMRDASVNKAAEIIRKTIPLEPHGYIIHINDDPYRAVHAGRWKERAGESIKYIIKETKVIPDRLCLENMEYPLAVLDDILNDHNVSICLDVGHLQQAGHDIKECFKKYIRKTKAIHLYKILENGRHGPLKIIDLHVIDWLKYFLFNEGYKGVVTLENFSEKDFFNSLQVFTGPQK
ncbi:cobamide remodeling phosphodiesterase CbiR [Elusimicrobiota bacterium]